jgi:hypothetical protein
MPLSPAHRWAITSLLCAGLTLSVASSSPTTAAATGADRMRFTFDEATPGAVLVDGASFADHSGLGNDGVVVTGFGGTVVAVGANGGTVLDFPSGCATQPCASAMVQIADDPTLDPRLSDFEWGASILMQANETDDGENVIQKGLNDEPGGQWKLQVDKAGGRPSCVVSGRVPGETVDRRVVLKASVDVANGVWHQVTCHRTGAGLQIIVDGVVNASAAMPVVDLQNNAPVTIGANFVTPSPNDQFHGMLDDVFMNAEQPPPTRYIEAVPEPAAALQFAVRLPVVESP